MPNKNLPSADIERYQGRSQTLTANAAGLTEVVGQAAENFERRNTVERVNLADMDAVCQRTAEYLRAVSARAMLPDIAGLAAWMGYSRRGLYAYADRHPDSSFSGFLKDMSDDFGAVTMAAAMHGYVAPVPAIFTTKSRYGWTEGPQQIQVVPPTTRFDRMNDEEKAEMYSKYSEMLDDDGENADE